MINFEFKNSPKELKIYHFLVRIKFGCLPKQNKKIDHIHPGKTWFGKLPIQNVKNAWTVSYVERAEDTDNCDLKNQKY